MATSSLHSLLTLFFFSFLIILVSSQSQPNNVDPKPSRFVLPVNKDPKTGLYVANVHKRTPLMQVPCLVDLNGKFLWVSCDQNYLSSTYHAPLCRSTQCAKADIHHFCHTCSAKARPGCHNNTCGLMSANPITSQTAMGELAQDVLSIQTTNHHDSNPGPMANIPNFLFACAPSFLAQRGLPKNAQGVAGLGHAPISLPTQLPSHFGFRPVFSLCLAQTGAVFFGNGPYFRSLGYTPLTISQQGEYYMEVKSIKINNKAVPLNTNLLSINKHGDGGTMISTTTPYMVLEHSIFTAVTQSFSKELYGMRVPQVKAVQPFGACFESKRLGRSPAGPGAPNIDLVLHNENVVWRIIGANSIVEAAPGVSCLAVVDGRRRRGASVVIGAYQLENNLVEFDLARSRLGFSSSLLYYKTSCSNFTTTA